MDFRAFLFKKIMIYLITGGARSGKSSYGQKLAKQLSGQPVYLATSRIWDDDHRARIDRHRADRDTSWTTVEEEKYLSNHDLSGKTVLLDCVTLWLTNYFTDSKGDVEGTLRESRAEMTKLIKIPEHLIIITNELGMGLHASTASGRKFADLQGWTNQFIAQLADEVYLMVAGIPVKIK